jgi:hypothetical protein
MEAPKLGGYSLRVQLFSPTVVTTSDRPVRLYRVVTRPDATVWEFCQEASRIHEINYGKYVILYSACSSFSDQSRNIANMILLLAQSVSRNVRMTKDLTLLEVRYSGTCLQMLQRFELLRRPLIPQIAILSLQLQLCASTR